MYQQVLSTQDTAYRWQMTVADPNLSRRGRCGVLKQGQRSHFWQYGYSLSLSRVHLIKVPLAVLQALPGLYQPLRLLRQHPSASIPEQQHNKVTVEPIRAGRAQRLTEGSLVSSPSASELWFLPMWPFVSLRCCLLLSKWAGLSESAIGWPRGEEDGRMSLVPNSPATCVLSPVGEIWELSETRRSGVRGGERVEGKDRRGESAEEGIGEGDSWGDDSTNKWVGDIYGEESAWFTMLFSVGWTCADVGVEELGVCDIFTRFHLRDDRGLKSTWPDFSNTNRSGSTPVSQDLNIKMPVSMGLKVSKWAQILKFI